MIPSFPFPRAALSALFFLSSAILCWFVVGSFSRATGVSTHFYLFVYTNPASGQEMYSQYCAGCHGTDGQGHGTAARYCTVPPADLASLAKKNHGLFPAKRVSQVLHSGTGKAPQGQGYMPVWAPLLKSMNRDKPDSMELRNINLSKYVETLQAPPESPLPKHTMR